jgi:4-methyl-5(b-hydroxyethyl)-thiazole monophosphate biosynthesis
MKKRVLCPLAPGFEELEAVAIIDLLRRAGAQVVTASVDTPNPVVGKHRIRVMADIDLPEALAEWGADGFDLVVLPGGPGVAGLAANAALRELLAARMASGRLVAAICAAPTVLAAAGLPPGTPLTCWPGSRAELPADADWRDAAVVTSPDGAIITGRGPGASIAFGLALVSALYGPAAAADLAESIAPPAEPAA